MTMDDELVEKVARAVRVDQFSRTRRSGKPDADTPLTEREVADAQAAIAAVLEHLSAVTPEMVEAGAKEFWGGENVPSDTGSRSLTAAYLAMLAKVKP